MSRCYAYRPTGGVSLRNGASSEALIESIKLQSVKVKPKTDLRKEKKREKKERRKEKKEKEGALYNFSDREAEKLKNENCCWGRDLIKTIDDDDTERSEKSGLTNEHDEPVCNQNLCYFSDGTRSSKRKRDSSPSSGIKVHRNIIRIRLPSQKQREANASSSEENSCSTSGRAPVSLAKQKENFGGQCIRTNSTDGEFSAISDSSRKENTAQYGKQRACGATVFENKKQREESIYKALIEDWVPPPHCYEPNDSDDQEWLFGTKQQGDGYKRFKAAVDVSGCQTLWPSAYYLRAADTYALPYTIPF